MYVCVYVCNMYACMYMYVHVCTCMYVCMYVCNMYVCILYVGMYNVYVCECVYIYIYMTCVSVCVCMCVINLYVIGVRAQDRRCSTSTTH